MRIKIDNITLVICIIVSSLLVVATAFGCMAAGVDFSGIVTKVPSSGIQVKVNGQDFQNGTAISWSNLQVGVNKKAVTVSSQRRLAIALFFPELPKGVTVSCPLNMTYIEPYRDVEDSIVLTMTTEAGSNGAEMSTIMCIFTEDVS